MPAHKAIVVFTARSAETIVAEGGSQAWRLKRSSAVACEFLVCVQNRRTDWGDGHAEHGAAFLVGRIADVTPSPEPDRGDRWIIRISDYAEVNVPDRWKQWRNPVRYSSLEAEGIKLEDLSFQPMPERPAVPEALAKPLSIDEAKRGIAASLGIGVEAIEIIIRT